MTRQGNVGFLIHTEVHLARLLVVVDPPLMKDELLEDHQEHECHEVLLAYVLPWPFARGGSVFLPRAARAICFPRFIFVLRVRVLVFLLHLSSSMLLRGILCAAIIARTLALATPYILLTPPL